MCHHKSHLLPTLSFPSGLDHQMPLVGNENYYFHSCYHISSEDFIKPLQLGLHLDPIAAQDTGDYLHFLSSSSLIFLFSHQFGVALVSTFQYPVYVIIHLLLFAYPLVFALSEGEIILRSDVSNWLRFPKVDASEPLVILHRVSSPAPITTIVVSWLIFQPLLLAPSTTLLSTFFQFTISNRTLPTVKTSSFLRPPTTFSASIFRALIPLSLLFLKVFGFLVGSWEQFTVHQEVFGPILKLVFLIIVVFRLPSKHSIGIQSFSILQKLFVSN